MSSPEQNQTNATTTGTQLRREVLATIEGCVCRDRQNTYGDAEDNFQVIADLANVVFQGRLTTPFTSLDMAMFQALVKVARTKSSPDHLDNWVDLAGYAVCGAGIVKRRVMNKDFIVPEAARSVGVPSPELAKVPLHHLFPGV